MILTALHPVAFFRHILCMEMRIFEVANEMFGLHLHHRIQDELFKTLDCVSKVKARDSLISNKPRVRM